MSKITNETKSIEIPRINNESSFDDQLNKRISSMQEKYVYECHPK